MDNKFNETVCAVWLSKNGKMYTSMPVDEKTLTTLKNVKPGGKFVFKLAAKRNTEKSPHGYVEYMTPEKVKEFKEAFAKKTTSDDDYI